MFQLSIPYFQDQNSYSSNYYFEKTLLKETRKIYLKLEKISMLLLAIWRCKETNKFFNIPD